ncbi:MAG: dihydroorotate dehydrogenase [Actinobacteria bacterium]|jgi:dihydroorotate dehydrogenase (NAD+) catalytic subunit|nr:dihydroorotate dehydrogenase [Actinomycetota bacterium]NDA41349.1 dihydroorotate dehydrogenase [Actinomycetota bacterium]NDB31294.1 dihydroorotate dehydrogenase [Actinomycetota bacterium]
MNETFKAFDFRTRFGSITFPSPIFTASGCAGSGKELSQFFSLDELGAIVTKSIAVKPRSGRATPRMAETPSGMLNSIGLQGPGIDQFLEIDIPWLISRNVRTIVSISGETVEEYATLARKLRSVSGLSGIEVNISCPNVENRGMVFACDPIASREVIQVVRRNLGNDLPIIAKLSPDVTDLVSIAQGVVDAGANGLALINTLLGMVIDIDARRPKLAGKTGGLSGPAIRPVAVRAIYQVHAALPQIPILGMGGVASGRDALELIFAGASGVSIGTATFGDPGAPLRIKRELEIALKERGFSSFADAVGAAHES